MSAIALPMINTGNAVTSAPVNIETGVLTFFKEDITGMGTGTNPPDAAIYSGYPKYTIRFKLNNDGRTGNTDEVVWDYGSDDVTRDADFTALIAATATTLP